MMYYLYFKGGISSSDYGSLQKSTADIHTFAGKHPKVLNINKIDEKISIINNKKYSEEERYDALRNIFFIFAAGYHASRIPEIREYSNDSLDELAEKIFPNQYEKSYFVLNCSDPTCGEKPNDELKAIREDVNKLKIPVEFLNTIQTNLEQTIYIPDQEKDEKMYGFTLVITQLEFENDAEASSAARRLRDYVKSNYSYEIPK